MDIERPVSRRQRPAKEPLSREWIIAATIDIMRREGLQAATMRRVAQALDTGPASLYVYVANTTELHAAVVDELVGTLQLRRRGSASTRLRRLVTDYRDLLLTHPGLARSALALRPSGPNTLRLLDTLVGLLVDSGLDDDRAAWSVDLVVLYATSVAAEHAVPATDDVTRDSERAGHALMAAVADAAGGTDTSSRRRAAVGYPHLARLQDALLGGTPAQRWEWALDVLLAGAAHTPTPLSPGKDAS